MKYKYSLIIPHFNIPKLLDRLLMTVPPREDLQVIVVDDCSNKDLDQLNILKNKYSKVEWYSTEINGGGGKARNIGLEHAKGEYVFFADADDFFLPNLNSVLDDYKNNNNVDIVFFNAISLDSKTFEPAKRGRNWQQLEKKLNNNISIDNFLRYLFGEPWCKIIKKSLIEENSIKFDEIPIHNDTYFSYMIGHYAKSIKIDTRFIYCVADRKNSTSKDISDDKHITRTHVFSKKNQFLKQHHINIFDDIIIPSFWITRKNKKLNRQLYQIAYSYGFSKKEINYHIFNILLKSLQTKIKETFMP